MTRPVTRRLGLGLGLSLFLALAPVGAASAQVVVESTTSTTSEVTITGRVTTTSTQTVVVPDVVVVPDAVVVPDVVVVPDAVVVPAPAPEPSSAPAPSLVPQLALRGELTMSGAHDMPLAGMTARFALDGGDGWGGGLALGYAGEIGTSAPSEILLALEAWRDFSPSDPLGFQLLGRAGTALVLEEGGPSARVLAQLGIGARVSIDPRLAILLDARAELRLRPAGAGPDGLAGPDLSAGLVTTMGLAIRLD